MCWFKPWWKKNMAHSWKKMHHCLQKCRCGSGCVANHHVHFTTAGLIRFDHFFDPISTEGSLRICFELIPSIYIYTKCQADLSFPKSVKDSRHFYCYYRFFLKSLWNKVRSTVPLAFLNANLPMVFRFRLVQRLVFRTKISGLQTSKCSRWSFLSNNPAATPPKRKN